MVYNVRSIIYYDGLVDTRIYRKGIEVGQKKKIKGYISKRKRENTEQSKEDDRRRSTNRCKNMVYQLARNNRWDWFVTLTLDEKKIDRYDYDLVSTKLTKWLNNLRRICPDMIYMFVPEQHKDGAYHLHGLMGRVENLRFKDSGHKDAKERIIYNVGNYKYGWSTATRVSDNEAVISYILKYITKELIRDTKGKRHYWASKNLEKPKRTYHTMMNMI